MRKQFFVFLAVLSFYTALSPQKIYALTSSAPSAEITKLSGITKADDRGQILRDYLNSYNSPLADSADSFVKEADKNGIDWKLLVAISGTESYFGQQLPLGSYNAWGYGIYGTNVRYFISWNDGIRVVSKDIRSLYMNKWGAKDIYGIGRLYAADPLWAYKVTHYMDQIESFQTEEENQTLSISL